MRHDGCGGLSEPVGLGACIIITALVENSPSQTTTVLHSGHHCRRSSQSRMHGAWYRWPHGSVIASSALHIGSRQMQHGSGCVALSGAPRSL